MRPQHSPLAPQRGTRIGLSPWSRDKIGALDAAALDARAAQLGVNVSTVLRTDRAWMVRVDGGERQTSLVGKGPLAAVIAGALDDWQDAA